MIGITLSLALVLAPAPSSPQDSAPAPGLVLVKGGRTKIGTSVKDIEQMIIENEPVANTLAGETPQVSMKLDDFYLMPNEVTNEQYAAFVQATGAQPPYYWGEKALEAGRTAWLEEEGKRIQALRNQGQTFERRKFDPAAWWEDNWESSEWEVPTDELNKPVVYISYENARDYAAWAGMRLMTEFEFERAARLDTDRAFPWGNEWDDREYCNSLHLGQTGTLPVGSFPTGASNGVFDLAGNVWEWTSSPYAPYDGYELVKVKVGRGATLEAGARFDPNKRVLRSGSYTSPQIGVRASLRQGADRSQRTEGVGFRCAADAVPGKTVADTVLEREIDLKVLPDDIEFYTPGTVAYQRWVEEEGTVEMDGYSVVTAYDKMMFTPVLAAPASSKTELARLADEGPMFLGFVSFSFPLTEPALDGGTYLVAYRPEAKFKEPEEDEAEDVENPFWKTHGFDPEKDQFYFYQPNGAPVVAFAAGEIAFKKMAPGSVSHEPFVPPTEEELEEMAKKGQVPPEPMDTLRFSLAVAGKSKSKGLLFDLPVKIAPGVIDDSWRP